MINADAGVFIPRTGLIIPKTVMLGPVHTGAKCFGKTKVQDLAIDVRSNRPQGPFLAHCGR
jgi:hypothetical protein